MIPAKVSANARLCGGCVRGRFTRSDAERRRNLERDVPSTASETEDHADGEENAPYEGLETHVEE